MCKKRKKGVLFVCSSRRPAERQAGSKPWLRCRVPGVCAGVCGLFAVLVGVGTGGKKKSARLRGRVITSDTWSRPGR